MSMFGTWADFVDRLSPDALIPLGVVLLVLFIFYLLLAVFALVSYVFNAIGLFSIARRRGVSHAWFAWIPVLNSYLLGAIGDHYDGVANGKPAKRRVVLLVCHAFLYIALIALLAMLSSMVTAAFSSNFDIGFDGMFLSIILLSLCVFIVVAVNSVFSAIAVYKVFASCTPRKKVLFFLLSMFLGICCFFIFAVRRKDDGMVPFKGE